MIHPRLIAPASLLDGFDLIRKEFEVPTAFSSDVLTEAHSAFAPEVARSDFTHVGFVAIDPAGATDLDQAFYAEPTPSGYRLYYAIADIAAFVTPGGAIDEEARQRGVTLYLPDQRTPLHPRILSEDRASLLPGGVRPALVWTFDLDPGTEVVGWRFERGSVRVREAISYAEAQLRIDRGAEGALLALSEIGPLRIDREVERGGMSLDLPSQRVHREDGSYHLEFEQTLDVERWNAQISLLTGMVAGDAMATAGVGVLRTLPEIRTRDVESLRLQAKALNLNWVAPTSYPEFVRTLSPTDPACTAFLYAAIRTLRGAGYQTLEPGVEPDPHGAIAAIYAHVTAPLRRLADRYANEIVLALSAGTSPAGWALEALGQLPSIMQRALARQGSIDRAIVDYMEAIVLDERVGQHFAATVISLSDGGDRTQIQIQQPPVVATLTSGDDLTPGLELNVVLESVDPIGRTITFRPLRTR